MIKNNIISNEMNKKTNHCIIKYFQNIIVQMLAHTVYLIYLNNFMKLEKVQI